VKPERMSEQPDRPHGTPPGGERLSSESMSQMTPYCFKCGAELEPETIRCPHCGRLQRSMVVRGAGPAEESVATRYAVPSRERYPSDPRPPGRMRTWALAAAGVLGLFLVGLVIGRACIGTTSNPSTTAVVATPPATAPAAGQPSATTRPTQQPTATPKPSAPAQPGAANFVRVASDIPGSHCTTAQGCPVTGTFKNNGGRGGGTAIFSLLDSGGSVVGTYTATLPVTEAGQSVDVSGYANGPTLPDYLKNGGLVTLKVDVQNT
jgi:hypothetical protein